MVSEHPARQSCAAEKPNQVVAHIGRKGSLGIFRPAAPLFQNPDRADFRWPQEKIIVVIAFQAVRTQAVQAPITDAKSPRSRYDVHPMPLVPFLITLNGNMTTLDQKTALDDMLPRRKILWWFHL